MDEQWDIVSAYTMETYNDYSTNDSPLEVLLFQFFFSALRGLGDVPLG